MHGRGQLFRGLLPAPVAVAEASGEGDGDGLFPAELTAVGNACERRRREFASARACARRAMSSLGADPVEIPRGERGEPLWPAGLIGSITHCEGLRAGAVARAGTLAAVGIDAEVDAPLPGRVLERIAFGPELELVRGGGARDPHLDRLLFSAKESVYKAWFPLARRWLGFEDVEVSIAPGSFRARLLVPGPRLGGVELTAIEGRWRAGAGLIATAAAIP